MIVRSLRLLPKKIKFRIEEEKGSCVGLGVTFNRVSLDELCAIYK
jgi:hypothetical protein